MTPTDNIELLIYLFEIQIQKLQIKILPEKAYINRTNDQMNEKGEKLDNDTFFLLMKMVTHYNHHI